MGKSETGRPLLRYGSDVTSEDVRVIDSFIKSRIAGLSHAERGSEGRQAARSVKSALLLLVGTLEYALSISEADQGRSDVEESLRVQICIGWNALWALASPWQWRDDYDRDRWRHVKYWDAAHEDGVNGILGRAFEE